MAAVGNLVVQTIVSPRSAARTLLAMNLAVEVRWVGLALVSVLTLFQMNLTLFFVPIDALTPIEATMRNPLAGVPIQAASLVVIAAAMSRVGQMFGGEGQFSDALLLIVWLEFVLLCLQIVQLALLLVAPALGTVVSFLAMGLFVWAMAHFISELHGFKSMPKVVIGMFLTFIALALLMGLALSALGIDILALESGDV